MTEKNFDDNSIVVSISCITYNHAPYIRQCIDGFLMQQTNFAFEVLIHDDASTDGTTEIIKEYEAKYPEIIKPIYEEENQWVKGRRGSAVFNFPRAKGKYIALCEGDDYWTDPLKLQKQVDFLEDNPNYVMCSHCYDTLIEPSGKLIENTRQGGFSYSISNYVRGEWGCSTLSTVFRLTCIKKLPYPIEIDVCLFYAILKQGDGYCMKDIMSVYRIHNQGVWSGIDINKRNALDFDIRLSLYDIDKSESSAVLILGLFTKNISRKWLFCNLKRLIKSMAIIMHHYGSKYALSILVKKMCFNYRFQFKDSESLLS